MEHFADVIPLYGLTIYHSTKIGDFFPNLCKKNHTVSFLTISIVKGSLGEISVLWNNLLSPNSESGLNSRNKTDHTMVKDA